ncbi:hypothetical protein F53441_11483 [Fusarium austroafricanum]|uniref:Uncharacterized protein n=1 Tax=Fusarium austroafricanum TaxID=2364996 RepID=A0A8H4NLY4_9HYPO|nr:hypothetical protein F53441_11483 [Fusarium austroafricanum]
MSASLFSTPKLERLWEMLENTYETMALCDGNRELVPKLHEIQVIISQKISSAVITAKQGALPPNSPPRTPANREIKALEPAAPFKPRIEGPIGTLSYPEVAAAFPPQPRATILSVAELKEVERNRKVRKHKGKKTSSLLMKRIAKGRKL